jgi:hypothetical protein
MKKTILFILTGIIAIAHGAVGDAGVAILKVPVDARICGMGEASCAFINNASAIYYNPAGLGAIKKFDIALMHSEWLLGMDHEFGAIAFSLGNAGAIGVSVNYWGSGKIPIVTIRGDTIPGETFSASDLIFDLGYGKKFGRFAFGLGFKYCMEHNEDFSGTAMAGNLGVQYAVPIKGLNIGASISNLGTSMQLDQESFSLPMIMRFGWNYSLGKLNIAQDVTIGDKFYFLVGVEYWLGKVFALRCGYKNDTDLNGLAGIRAGLGLNFKGFGIDYGFAPYGDLGGTHRFTLSFRPISQ